MSFTPSIGNSLPWRKITPVSRITRRFVTIRDVAAIWAAQKANRRARKTPTPISMRPNVR